MWPYAAIRCCSQDDIDAGFVFSNATVKGWSPFPGLEVIRADKINTVSLPQQPSIFVDKSLNMITTTDGIDLDYSDPGDAAYFNITVTNTGNTRLSQVEMSDDMFDDEIACDHDFSGAKSNFLPGSHPDSLPILCEAKTYLTPDDVDAGFIKGTTKVSQSSAVCLRTRHLRSDSSSITYPIHWLCAFSMVDWVSQVCLWIK